LYPSARSGPVSQVGYALKPDFSGVSCTPVRARNLFERADGYINGTKNKIDCAVLQSYVSVKMNIAMIVTYALICDDIDMMIERRYMRISFSERDRKIHHVNTLVNLETVITHVNS
jgi:hypothetical protein